MVVRARHCTRARWLRHCRLHDGHSDLTSLQRPHKPRPLPTPVRGHGRSAVQSWASAAASLLGSYGTLDILLNLCISFPFLENKCNSCVGFPRGLRERIHMGLLTCAWLTAFIMFAACIIRVPGDESRLPHIRSSQGLSHTAYTLSPPCFPLLVSEPQVHVTPEAWFPCFSHLDAWGSLVVIPSPGLMAAVTTCLPRGRVAPEGPGGG